MDGDKFISTIKTEHIKNQYTEDSNNFFVQNEASHNYDILNTDSIKHINDYDSNILSEDAYREVDNKLFKLEYKISKKEEEIKDLEKQISTANEIYDYYMAETLTKRKNQLSEELITLTKLYNETSLSAKISDNIVSKIKKSIYDAGKLLSNFSESVISMLPGKISYIMEVRSSLDKLASINKSVDELMHNKYPYGEASAKYEQLSKYIARANSIQSEIYKFIK